MTPSRRGRRVVAPVAARPGRREGTDEVSGPDLLLSAEFDPHPAESSLSQRSGAGVLWLSISLGLVTILQFGSVVVTSRLLRPADFGLIAAGALILRLVNYLAQGGMAGALVQFERLTPTDVSTAFTISLVFGFSATLLGVALSPVAGAFLGPRATAVTAALSLDFLLAAGGVVAIALLRRQLRFRETAAIEVSSYAFGYLAVGIPLAIMGAGVWALVAAALSQTLLSTVTSYSVVRHAARPRYERSSARKLLAFGSRSSASGFLEFWGLQVDAVTVAMTKGSASLGLYTRGSVLVSIPIVQASTLTSKVLGSSFSRVDSPAAVRRAMTDTLAVLAAVIIPVGTVLAISTPLTTGLILGSQFRAAAIFLPLTVIGASFQGLTQLFTSLSEARALLRQRLAIQLFVLLLFVGEAAVVAAFHGSLLWFAATWAVTEAVRHIVYLTMLTRKLRVPSADLLKAYGGGLLLGLAPALLALILGRDLHGSVIRLVGLGAGCLLLWLIGVVLLPRSPLRQTIRSRGLLQPLTAHRWEVVRTLARAVK